MPTPPTPLALLFDMDGTITEPLLDFPQIKRDLGIGDRAILEAMAEMNREDRAKADAILRRHEEHGALNSSLNRGCRDLMRWIAEARIPTALVTRNSHYCMSLTLERHGLTFDTIITRDDGTPKPDAWPLLHACERLGVSREQVWMVGDGRYDIEAGNAARIYSVWVSHGRVREFAAIPDAVVEDLPSLLTLLKEKNATSDTRTT